MVGVAQKEKTNNTILSNQFQKPIKNRRKNHNTPTMHIYMNAHISGNQGLSAFAT